MPVMAHSRINEVVKISACHFTGFVFVSTRPNITIQIIQTPHLATRMGYIKRRIHSEFKDTIAQVIDGRRGARRISDDIVVQSR